MGEKTKEKRKFDLSSYGKAVSFLLLEVLAVTSFSLGGSFLFFTILSMVILALIVLVSFRQIKLDGLSSIGFFLFPILIFGIISALSYFKYDPYYSLGNSPLLFFVPITLCCFAASGYLVNVTGSFKLRHALIVIYSAISLLTLINLFVTMIQFVPFYPLRYSNYYYYYDGVPSPAPIGQMGYFLMGFSLVEVSLQYFCFYPMILLTAFLPLGRMKFKDNKKIYLAYLGFGVLGLLTIILTINKITLLMFFGVAILIGVIALIDKFNINRKALKITAISVSSLAILGLLFVFLNAQDSVGYAMRVAFIRNLTTGNSLFNRLFNSNRFISSYNSILDGLFASIVEDGSRITLKLLGFPIHGDYVYLFGDMTWKLTDSNSFFFDSFFESGLFGTIFFIAFIVLGIRKVIQYYNKSNDNPADKVMVLGFVIISFAYAFVGFDATPYIFSKSVIPFYLNNIFFINLFLFGYCFYKVEEVKPVKAKEEVKDEQEK